MQIHVEKKLYEKINLEIKKQRIENEIVQPQSQKSSTYIKDHQIDCIRNEEIFESKKPYKTKYAFVGYCSAFLLGILSYRISSKVNQQMDFYQELGFRQSSYDMTQMLYDILENNSSIDSQYFEQMKQLEKFLIQTSAVDYQLLTEKFTTLQIEKSNKVVSLGDNIILADYDMNQNVITIYPNAGGSEKQIPHEFLHVIGYLSGYHYLNEGISELLHVEYCNNGYPSTYWQNVHCVKILCELISPKVILGAYCSCDATPIVESLTNLCGNQDIATSLLQTMDSYCEKDMLSTVSEKDFYQLKSKVLTFLLLTYKNKPIDRSYEQVKQYIELMAYPSINRTEEPILYFYNTDDSILQTSKQMTSKIKKYLKYD